ncbi:MAG TPA: phenylalanine--tRNA ligase subunit beta, partial [Armatimonadetes bacterium]|nr:phenylalanine--tRNA ligase subunit beta [Armatimonadota bacterium]
MRIPLKWLKEWVETDLGPEEVAEVLTNLGFETTVEDLRPQGIDDFVLDIEVTSNRGDCLSVRGIGRELAAATGAKFLDWAEEYSSFEGEGPEIGEVIAVEIEDPKGCPRYCAMAVLGVEVGPSPPWMRERLLACGIQPINNVVDVTNYVMLELGQPLHAFDLDTLRGRKIIVRRAREGERLVTLDEVERELSPSDLIIADAERAVALAGVMGGLHTGVLEYTKNVLLEGANFDHASIRRTAKRLGMSTEASYRFERRVDPELPPIALRRAARLILELAGGRVAKGMADNYPGRRGPRRVRLRLSRIPELLGAEVGREEVERILSALGFGLEKGEEGALLVLVPSWRPDVEGEADLVEEVARVYGYNRFPSRLPDIGIPRGWLAEGRRIERKAQDILAS